MFDYSSKRFRSNAPLPSPQLLCNYSRCSNRVTCYLQCHNQLINSQLNGPRKMPSVCTQEQVGNECNTYTGDGRRVHPTTAHWVLSRKHLLVGTVPGLHHWDQSDGEHLRTQLGGHGFSLGKHLGANWTPLPCAKCIFEFLTKVMAPRYALISLLRV